MKVSLSWLREYTIVDIDIEDLADALTMVGLEVEVISDRYNYLGTVVVGRIDRITSHPNAENLKLCAVDIGHRSIQVVCGAPNIRKDMMAPCVMPGTCLPHGAVLEKGAIYGEMSEGMLCSEAELGLGDKSGGVMELGGNHSAGEALNKSLELSDAVLEIDLTPNRPDCLSIIGIAREIAAIQKTKVTYPKIPHSESFDNILDYTSVAIIDPELCPRYAASLVFEVTVAPSPFWLQDRLLSIGLKPINNIVDITNFVMMETGQPLHAFDFDRLAENRIVVRKALDGEIFMTLDGKEHPLDPEMLMICDGEKPVAIGGVMGGMNSEIEDSTTRILLESAYFNPISIRKTSKKLGLNTDASHRFERGVDPDGTVRVLKRATQLIMEIGGGRRIGGIIDEHPHPIPSNLIVCSVKDLNRRLGTRLKTKDIENYLKSIEFDVEKIENDRLRILPPSYRVDIRRFEDITEEIARLYGYNNIETTFPMIPAKGRQPSYTIESRDRIKRLMTGTGFIETVTYSFINKLSCDRLELKSDDPKRKMVNILNPLTEDQSVMRTSLIPGLIESMNFNLSVQNRNLKLFEIGNVFFNTDEKDAQPNEVEMLAGLWTGARSDLTWYAKEFNCDLYDLKGVVEELFRNLGISNAVFARMPPESCFYTRPGYSAQIFLDQMFIGLIGELHPRVLTNYNLKQTAFIFELNFDDLIARIPRLKSARSLSKFPSTSRDITLIVDGDIEASNILESVEMLDENLVEHLHLFAVFEGPPIPVGKKSISFRITYLSFNETLEDDRVNHIHKNITAKLVNEYNATLPTI
ncbi:MAG: phenylalanine--tRNA ligase subunit beta [Deltaproteobacteria bacterium]|nr:phenylalanine--tRNA ligase subunit beta [Deltaproteobacteria bacterium]